LWFWSRMWLVQGAIRDQSGAVALWSRNWCEESPMRDQSHDRGERGVPVQAAELTVSPVCTRHSAA